MKSKSFISSIFFALLVSSCNHTKEVAQPSSHIVNFTGSFNEQVSRASNTSWSKNDAIGVFMLKSADKQVLEINKQYITTSENGYFTPINGNLLYPTNGDKVDFIAYYPYMPGTTLASYAINTATQNNLEAIDILYSNNLTERNSTHRFNTLQFRHLMSKIVLNISSEKTLTGLTATIKDIKTKGTLDLKNGTITLDETSTADVPMHISNDQQTAEAVLLPQTQNSTIKITLQFNGKTRTFDTKLSQLEGGVKYTYNIKVKGNNTISPEAPDYKRWRETPVITADMMKKKHIHYINHTVPGNTNIRNYSLLYDSEMKISYWVAYPLCPYYTGSGRYEKWDYDPAISSTLQPNMKKGLGSNYDRGHQIPNADRNANPQLSYTTFYYTNMTAQIGKKLNQTIWQSLEEKVRSWMSGTDTVFVVTGAVPTTAENPNLHWYTNPNDSKRIVVPKAYYKVLARKIQGKFTTIGFYLEHKEYNDRNFMQYATSVSEVEKKTGFTFFPSIEKEIKDKYNQNEWQ